MKERTYKRYGTACAVVWLVVLAVTTRSADPDKQRTIRVVCGGWWLGWLSATIARHVYPPPRRWRAPS
jgi:hypothetical protein